MYVDLIIPVPLQKAFTYSVPESMTRLVSRGGRVLVQFGKKKYYAGIVLRVHDERPDYETKAICEVADTEPIVRESQLRMWEWMSDYYICTMGEVMKAAMPQGLKLESESRLMYNALWEGDRESLSGRQSEVLAFVETKKCCTIADVAQMLGGVNPISHIRALIEADAIFISEELRDSYKQKTTTVYSLVRDVRSEDELMAVFDSLEKRAPRQLETLMCFLTVAGGTARATDGVRVSRDELAKDERVSMTAVAELVKKGILESHKVAVSRLGEYDKELAEPAQLTAAQQLALEQIEAETRRPVLLHGVTGSGKTEIYIHLIKRAMAEGRNVLYLLPEIALTTQITNRLRRHFGDSMVVYHSKFSDAERVEVWMKMLGDGVPRLVLGVRSSILLPLSNLGLIIVDEEHESSYKQYDPAPRYNARDMAVVLSRQMEGCQIVLGSATPSLESWSNAQEGKYALVSLTERHAGLQLPTVEIIDMTEAKKKRCVAEMFSFRLKEVIENALERKEQVILFQNRRGFAPVVECRECAWVPKCINCDVNLTFHKSSNMLVCHYCGHTTTLPTTCPACGTPTLDSHGYGTERIEEVCKTLFPTARVVRMDLDTARSRRQFETIIGEFADRQHDILIGTQMVSKGLDFEGVSTVGIMNADAPLNIPDFRADERAFQLMAQVSGRAGRRHTQGQVFIQASNASHPVIENLKQNDFETNAVRVLGERQAYHFPPYYRMVSLMVKHKDLSTDIDASLLLAQMLRERFGQMVTGPLQPVVGRVSNLYMQEISIKMAKTISPSQVKRIMMDDVNTLVAQQRFRSVVVRINVDPY